MRLLRNKKAVSPVVGVILMVAITIVLAATIYIWVSGMSSPSATAPNINFRGAFVRNESESSLYDLTLTVISVQGEVRWEDLNVSYVNATGTQYVTQYVNLSDQNLSGAVKAGDQITINGLTSGDEVKVTIIHIPSNTVIYERTFQVP